MFDKIWRVVWEGRPYYEENEWHTVRETSYVLYQQNTFTGERRVKYVKPTVYNKSMTVDSQWVSTGIFLEE